MKRVLSFTLLLATFGSQAQADTEQACTITKDLLGAHYRVTMGKVGSKSVMTESSDLWRTKHKVLTVNGQQSITWFKLSNGSVQKTAHFDHFKRSIEYPAKPMADDRWQQISQFIPNSQIKSLTLTSTQKEGCWQQNVYQWQNEATNLVGKLVWNDDLKLVTSLDIRQDNQQKHWQLEKLEQSESIISQAFAQRANYQSTDFADIGDNETDPFLIKMINLGFIEHGSSGVYNTQGESIDIEHNH